MNVNFFVVIEDQQYSEYAKVIDSKKLLLLDKTYQRKYQTCDTLGLTKSVGPGPARNFAWDHSISLGHKWHWVMDDNIMWFYRYNANKRIRVADGTIFKVMEDFCLRYKNVAMAGPHYRFFVAGNQKYPPFVKNTRIYSCNLIRNDVPFRWRGRYNEDTILSLDMLKANWCTVQFNAFLQGKMVTQSIKGGNTADFYAKEGTLPKSRMLIQEHPDCSRLTFKYNRWHHHVDYSRFKDVPMIKRDDIRIDESIDNYGMSLKILDK